MTATSIRTVTTTATTATTTTTTARIATATMTRYMMAGPAHEAGSVFEDQPPASVYQTLISEGKQDSSSLLMMRVRLSAAAAAACDAALRAGRPIDDVVYGSIRNFDGTGVRMYDPESKSMQFLQLPQDLFRFDLLSGALRISVHRKYLPVSKCHGNAPFVFAFLIKPAREVVVTTPFTVLSKEPKTPDAPKAPVKRVRRPPPKPFAAAHSDEGVTISEFLAGGGGGGGPRAAPAADAAHVELRTPSPIRAVAGPSFAGPIAGIVVPTDFAMGQRKRTRVEAARTDRPSTPGSTLDALYSGGGSAGSASLVSPVEEADAFGRADADELYMDGTFGDDGFGTPPLTEDEFQLFLGLEDTL